MAQESLAQPMRCRRQPPHCATRRSRPRRRCHCRCRRRRLPWPPICRSRRAIWRSRRRRSRRRCCSRRDCIGRTNPGDAAYRRIGVDERIEQRARHAAFVERVSQNLAAVIGRVRCAQHGDYDIAVGIEGDIRRIVRAVDGRRNRINRGKHAQVRAGRAVAMNRVGKHRNDQQIAVGDEQERAGRHHRAGAGCDKRLLHAVVHANHGRGAEVADVEIAVGGEGQPPGGEAGSSGRQFLARRCREIADRGAAEIGDIQIAVGAEPQRTGRSVGVLGAQVRRTSRRGRPGIGDGKGARSLRCRTESRPILAGDVKLPSGSDGNSGRRFQPGSSGGIPPATSAPESSSKRKTLLSRSRRRTNRQGIASPSDPAINVNEQQPAERSPSAQMPFSWDAAQWGSEDQEGVVRRRFDGGQFVRGSLLEWESIVPWPILLGKPAVQ